MKVRFIPCDLDDPVDTGLVQLGQDLPGLFISRDQARDLAMALEGVARHSNAQSYHMVPVLGLLRQLRACNPTERGRY